MPDTPETPRDEIAYPEAYRDLVVVSLALSLAMLANTMLLLTVPFMALELQVSPAMIGLIVAAPYVLPLVLAIPIGGFVGRMGARNIILAGALGMSAGPLCSLFFPSLTGLLANQVIAGMSNMVLIIAAQSLVSGLGQGRVLERCFGWYTMCMSAGQLLGPLLAGYLIEHYSLHLSFATIAFIPLLSFVSALFFSSSAGYGGKSQRGNASYVAQWRLLRTNHGVQLAIIMSSVSLFIMGAHAGFMPIYLEGLAISASLIGVLLSLRALTSILVRLVMSRMIDWLGGRTRSIQIGVVVVTGALMLTGMVGDQVVLLALLTIAIGVAGGISQPLSMVILSESVSREQRSPSLATRLMGNRLAQASAPVMVGFLAELYGFPTAFALSAGILLLLFLVWSWRVGLGHGFTVDRRDDLPPVQ